MSLFGVSPQFNPFGTPRFNPSQSNVAGVSGLRVFQPIDNPSAFTNGSPITAGNILQQLVGLGINNLLQQLTAPQQTPPSEEAIPPEPQAQQAEAAPERTFEFVRQDSRGGENDTTVYEVVVNGSAQTLNSEQDLLSVLAQHVLGEDYKGLKTYGGGENQEVGHSVSTNGDDSAHVIGDAELFRMLEQRIAQDGNNDSEVQEALNLLRNRYEPDRGGD